MAKKDHPNADQLYLDFLYKQDENWRKNGVRLTEQDFLQTIDPTKEYSQDYARNYMKNLANGKWSSKNVLARSQQSTGKRYNVVLKDSSGLAVDSITVLTVRGGRSIHQIYMSGELDAQIDRAMQKRFHKRMNDIRNKRPDLFDEDGEFIDDDSGESIDSPGHDGSEGLAVAGFTPVGSMNRAKNVQIIR